MKIASITVDGFGVWSGLQLADLAGELIVFYGPNEAGKSTLVEFVRSMFYGFSPERRTQYLPPVRPGRAGGMLQATAGARMVSLLRHADTTGESLELSVSQNGMSLADPPPLPALLGNVDESIFNNVYVFGLREIQELSTLTDTQAADELYNLALGLDRVSLPDVLGELEASRNRLLAADDRPSLVAQLLSQRERLQGEIEALSQSTHRYLSLSSQRANLADEVNRLEAQITQLDEQARELALARALTERWRQRASIDERLQLLVGVDSLPDDALARFEQIMTRLRARRRRMIRLKKARRGLREQIDALTINEPLCRQAPRFEALAEQQHWIGSLEADIAQLESGIGTLETERQENRQSWGQQGSGNSGSAEPLSPRAIKALRSAASELRAARREMHELRAAAEAAATSAGGVDTQLAGVLGADKQQGLTQALAEAGELVSRFRQRVQLDGRLDQMSRRQAELEEQSHEHLENQILPGWALVVIGSLFVLGCGLVLLFVAGLVLPASLSASLSWPVGLVGVLAAGAAAGAKFGLEQAAAKRLDSCHAQIDMLAQQVESARAERDELDALLPRGGGPLVSRMQAAEKELARLEALLPLESQRQEAQREAEDAGQQAQQRRAHYRRLRSHWRTLLAQHGLPDDLSPAQLPQYCRRRNHLRSLDDSIAQKRDELTRLRAQYDALTRRIGQAAADAGMTPQGQRPLDQLRLCLAELSEQQLRVKRRDELERQLDRLSRRHSRAVERVSAIRRRRQRLLRAAGTNDEQEFRRRAAVQAEAVQLRSQRSVVAQEIASALEGRLSEERIAPFMSSTQSLEAAENQVAEARRDVAGQLSQALVTRGEINQQLKMLVEDRALAEKRIELGVVEKRLQDALDRWRVLAICRRMLDSVRDYYEREHQPEALREASGYLERMTAGRYTRVWTALGEHALRVDDSLGKCLGVDVLSRGTREQLFLALRLALVTAYGRRGVQLPLVLDDVLVNFDVTRAKAAAAVLRDFARGGQQILVFTCHEHIAKLFKQLKADVRQLPDNGHAAVAAEPPARRVRRARPSAPVEPPVEIEAEPDFEPPIENVEPPALPEPAAAEPPPPAPVSRPPQPRPRRQRFDWSAEEFAGELADRVRADRVSEPERESGGPRVDGDDDAEAA
jgi:uncharacterized protein YhaN